MEDTYSMKDLTQYLIAEVKQQKFLKDLWNQNTIELNNYFKHSGKTEKSTKNYSSFEDHINEYNKFHQKNQQKIIKKTEKYNKIIIKERAKEYKKYRKK